MPVGQVKNENQSPDSKIHEPRAIRPDFLCTLDDVGDGDDDDNFDYGHDDDRYDNDDNNDDKNDGNNKDINKSHLMLFPQVS